MSKTSYPTLDFTGLKCPLPVLKARRALTEKAIGEGVIILADDPAAPLDFEHFCETSGHELRDVTRHDSHVAFTIVKR